MGIQWFPQLHHGFSQSHKVFITVSLNIKKEVRGVTTCPEGTWLLLFRAFPSPKYNLMSLREAFANTGTLANIKHQWIEDTVIDCGHRAVRRHTIPVVSELRVHSRGARIMTEKAAGHEQYCVVRWFEEREGGRGRGVEGRKRGTERGLHLIWEANF